MKKSLLALTTIISMAVITEYSVPSSAASFAMESVSTGKASFAFTDMQSHWSKEAVQKAIQAGYVDGYEDLTFRPDRNVSRAEFIKLAASATGLKVEVKEGSLWYMPYIKALQVEGVLDAAFYTDDMNLPMARGEMAMIAAKAVNKSLSGTMIDATELGLIHGLSGGELAPDGHTTRAQAITVINRMLDKKAGKEIPVDKYAISQAYIDKTGSNVEYVFGLKPQNIGTTWGLGEGASVKLEQLVIADPSDENDPYMDFVRKEPWNENVDKQRDVVVLAKFKVQIDESADDSVILYANQHLTLYDGTGLLRLVKEGLPRVMGFDSPGTYSGFVAYGIKRDLAKYGLGFDVVGNKVYVADK